MSRRKCHEEISPSLEDPTRDPWITNLMLYKISAYIEVLELKNVDIENITLVSCMEKLHLARGRILLGQPQMNMVTR